MKQNFVIFNLVNAIIKNGEKLFPKKCTCCSVKYTSFFSFIKNSKLLTHTKYTLRSTAEKAHLFKDGMKGGIISIRCIANI
jgi:hypothetical protein